MTLSIPIAEEASGRIVEASEFGISRPGKTCFDSFLNVHGKYFA